MYFPGHGDETNEEALVQELRELIKVAREHEKDSDAIDLMGSFFNRLRDYLEGDDC